MPDVVTTPGERPHQLTIQTLDANATGALTIRAAGSKGGTWTIIVIGHLDPPNAVRVAAAIRRQLQR